MNRSSAIRARSPVHLLGWATALLFALFSFTAAQAQAPDDDALDADPPDRAVRLSYIQGDVSLQPAGEEEWATAVVNRPLTTGDKLWTEDNARVEMYVGGAAVRLSGDTGFSFLNVDDDTIQMRITAGVMDVRVRSLDANDHIEIDTPNLALSLLRPGKYRVEVNDEGDATIVKVSEGEAEASGGSQDVVVHAQQAVTFSGTDRVVAQNGSLGAPDAFDSWSLDRDRRDQVALTSKTAQYVDPEVTGYEDLDDNGSWSSEPEYGYVWTPTHVAVDWSPYRYGHWVWVRPWGWTWVDDAPWGYAPFHYGRWAHVRERWCWVPGPRHVRPVYAPALVGWVGSPGVDVSITIGGGAGVAWFPLGPREVYVPARRYSPRYVERVNVSNTVIVNKTYITNVYEGRARNVSYRNRGAVTAVTRTTFTSAQPVGRNVVRIDEREVTRVGVRGAAPRIQPVRESVLGANRAPANWRKPPATVVERQVVVKREPPRQASRFVRNPDTAERRPDRNDGRGDNRNDRRDDARTAGGDRSDARDQKDRGKDARDQADRARDQADRDRNGLREQTERERAERQAQTDRDRAQRGRDDANRDQAKGDQADRAARVERDAQQARDAQNRDADQRDRDQRNAERRDPDQTNENRPAQARMRTDRPARIPDHINRGNPTDRADRDQQDRDRQQQGQQDRDRQQQDRQAQQDRDRAQAQDNERQARANRESDERDRQSQLDSKRQVDVQRDRQQAQQDRDRAQAQDRDRQQQERQAQQDRQRETQQAREQAQAQDNQRQQQERDQQQAQDRARQLQERDQQQAQDRARQQQERDQQQARQQQERQLQQDRQREAQQARQQAEDSQRQQQERQAQDRERQARMERDQQQAQDRARQQQERQQAQAMRDQQQQEQRERMRQAQDQQRQQAQQQAQQAQQQAQQDRMRQAQADRQQQQAQERNARAEAQRSRPQPQQQQPQPQQGNNERNGNDRGGRHRPNDAPDR